MRVRQSVCRSVCPFARLSVYPSVCALLLFPHAMRLIITSLVCRQKREATPKPRMTEKSSGGIWIRIRLLLRTPRSDAIEQLRHALHHVLCIMSSLSPPLPFSTAAFTSPLFLHILGAGMQAAGTCPAWQDHRSEYSLTHSLAHSQLRQDSYHTNLECLLGATLDARNDSTRNRRRRHSVYLIVDTFFFLVRN